MFEWRTRQKVSIGHFAQTGLGDAMVSTYCSSELGLRQGRITENFDIY
jgi:hypothetical protein